MSKTFVCRVQDIATGEMKGFSANGARVLVINNGGDFFACAGVCPHQEVLLEEGIIDGCVLTCHSHLWQWDVRTGAPIGLAEVPLDVYRVQREDDSLYILAPTTLALAKLFTGISATTFQQIEQLARREEVEQGETLYEPGEPAGDFFVLESGRVEFAIGRDDRTAPAGFMVRKGEVFGWAALLEDRPARFAKAVCLEKSALLRISGPATLALLEADPVSGYAVMRRLSSLLAHYLGYPGSR